MGDGRQKQKPASNEMASMFGTTDRGEGLTSMGEDEGPILMSCDLTCLGEFRADQEVALQDLGNAVDAHSQPSITDDGLPSKRPTSAIGSPTINAAMIFAGSKQHPVSAIPRHRNCDTE